MNDAGPVPWKTQTHTLDHPRAAMFDPFGGDSPRTSEEKARAGTAGLGLCSVAVGGALVGLVMLWAADMLVVPWNSIAARHEVAMASVVTAAALTFVSAGLRLLHRAVYGVWVPRASPEAAQATPGVTSPAQ